MLRKSIKKCGTIILNKITIISLMLMVLLLLSGTCVQANSVEYRGEVEGLIATPEDFFSDFGTLLPGDKREGVAYIKNTTKDEIEVFFKTEPLDKTEYYDDIDYSLLEKINLKISLKKNGTSSEQVLYEGHLGATNFGDTDKNQHENMTGFMSLGTYSKGFDGEFIFRIEVPTSLRNDYTLSRTKVKWVFAVEKKDKAEPKPDDSNPQKPDDNTGKKDNPVEQIINQVQTGDKIRYIMAILIIFILILALLYIQNNKGRN